MLLDGTPRYTADARSSSGSNLLSLFSSQRYTVIRSRVLLYAVPPFPALSARRVWTPFPGSADWLT
jgi:hypothetical protein